MTSHVLPDVELNFSQTVPCTIAHRRALGEVFVADSAQADRDEFVFALQVPRAHSLWNDRRIPCHDPFSMGEAARQATFVLIHRYLGIPREQPFTLRRFTLRVHDVDAFHDDEATPLEGVLRYRVRNRNGLATGIGVLGLHGDLFLRGRHAMSVSAEVVSMVSADYAVMRAFQRAQRPESQGGEAVPTIAAAVVGRYDERNVVISEPHSAPVNGAEMRFTLVLDQRHPSFFDHSYDHLPGPVAVEGLRQAAVVTATGTGALATPITVVTGCEVDFGAFGYLEHPLECSAEVRGVADDGPVEVAVGMYQFGSRLIDGKITLVPFERRLRKAVEPR